MDVLLLRHGKTESNLRGYYCGRNDEPLCPEGVRDAESAGSDPAVGLVYVSPLMRARQTAAILFPNARQAVIDDFREMDFGAFEGRGADELERDAAYREWVDGQCLGACPGGESTEAFTLRVTRAFCRLTADAAARGEANLVIVAHGGTLMAVMNRYAMPGKAQYFDWYPANCGGWRGEWDGEKILRWTPFEKPLFSKA